MIYEGYLVTDDEIVYVLPNKNMLEEFEKDCEHLYGVVNDIQYQKAYNEFADKYEKYTVGHAQDLGGRRLRLEFIEEQP